MQVGPQHMYGAVEAVHALFVCDLHYTLHELSTYLYTQCRSLHHCKIDQYQFQHSSLSDCQLVPGLLYSQYQ